MAGRDSIDVAGVVVDVPAAGGASVETQMRGNVCCTLFRYCINQLIMNTLTVFPASTLAMLWLNTEAGWGSALICGALFAAVTTVCETVWAFFGGVILSPGNYVIGHFGWCCTAPEVVEFV